MIYEIELPIEELHNICNELVNIEQQGYLKPRLLDGVFLGFFITRKQLESFGI